jgi:hypothetical protein
MQCHLSLVSQNKPYAECHYAECRYAESRGAQLADVAQYHSPQGARLSDSCSDLEGNSIG